MSKISQRAKNMVEALYTWPVLEVAWERAQGFLDQQAMETREQVLEEVATVIEAGMPREAVE